MTKTYIFEYGILFLSVCYFTGYLFYRSYYIGLIGIPFLPLFYRWIRKQKGRRNQSVLSVEFIDYLYGISSALETGVSLQSALESADQSLALMQKASSLMRIESSLILEEMMHTSCSAITALQSFAARTGLKEGSLFSAVCEICTDHGGNLAVAVHHAEMLLTDRLELKRNLEAKLTEKRLEFYILLAMPFVILFYLTYASSGYMDILYTSRRGYTVITVSLLLMILAVLWSNRILNGISRQSEKEQEVIREMYPVFLDELILYMNAGVIMETAIHLTIQAHTENNAFYNRMRSVADREREMNQPLEYGFHEWARESGIPEIMRFSGILSDVIRKGVDPVPKLELEAALVRQMKTRTIEKKGQSAETKLVFPMALLLIALLLMTIAPVFLEMER